jgi:hypothetical protein
VSETETPTAAPVLRVVSGSPTAEELAVVTAIVAAAGSGSNGGAETAQQRGGWSDPKWTHRDRWLPGPNAWRSAGR